MVVMMLENIPTRLKGELTRWLLEPRAGVFVGRCSAMVREKLWTLAQKEADGGAGIMVYSANVEQGFQMEMFGVPSRTLISLEGLQMVLQPEKST